MAILLFSYHRLRRLEKRLRRDRKGATAVEFAFVALPFFALMAAVMETALVFFASIMLENGLTQAAREIRTGQVQVSGGSADAFRDGLCGRTAGILDCQRLQIDARTLGSFGGAPGLPIGSDGQVNGDDFSFTPGNAGDIVMVRVFYEWQLVVPGFGIGLANMAGNKRLLTATIAFRNEPFEEGA